jgi:hypothetical protein
MDGESKPWRAILEFEEGYRNITAILKDGDINEGAGGVELDLNSFKRRLWTSWERAAPKKQ